MRQIVRQAVEGARDEMLSLRDDVRQDRRLSQEEMLQRYLTQHRGNVNALLDFASRQASPDASVLQEAVRYENEMERLYRAQGGG